MDLLLCWLIAPLGLLVCTLGLSLLVERVSGFTLPWGLRPALGLGVAIVFAQFGTWADATAELTIPAILVLAALGIILGFDRLGAAPSWAEIVVPGLTFLLLASPFIISGEATWAGIIKLDDTASWMGIVDHSFESGRKVGDLAPSTYKAMLDYYLGASYPIGGFVPAALMRDISGQDVAFTMQPSMAFAVAAMASAIFELTRRLLSRTFLAASIAVLASLSSILLGYYLWGGVKEMVVAALLPLLAALGGLAMERDWPRRTWIPLSVAAGAVIAALGPGGASWVVAILLGFAVVLALGPGLARVWAIAWPVAIATLVFSLPVLITPEGIFNPVQGTLTETVELGNLPGPINPLHAAGIWPALDFRSDPHLKPAVLALAVLCLGIAVVTVYACFRMRDRRGLPFACFVAGATLGALLIIVVGSPWVDAKAMATASPALLAAALLGPALLIERTPFKLEAGAVAAVIAGAVVWSAFLAYQGVYIAHRPPFDELEDIGKKFAGDGPALSTEVAIYGPRHFLRKLDPEGATDLRYRQVLLRGGQESEDGVYVNLDDIETTQLDPYNLIVVRRSPAESRPPASFSLAYSGDYYDVWRRQPAPGTLIDHLPLGNRLDPGGVPSCDRVEELASAAGSGGRLVAARVDEPYTMALTGAQLPAGWRLPTPVTFAPTGSGTLEVRAGPGSGSFDMWLGGVVFGGLDLSVDGKKVASVDHLVQNDGAMEPLGTIQLGPGTHTFTFDYSGAGLQPGSASDPWVVGPLMLVPPSPAADPGTITVQASDWHQLCGSRWDWIEAYQ